MGEMKQRITMVAVATVSLVVTLGLDGCPASASADRFVGSVGSVGNLGFGTSITVVVRDLVGAGSPAGCRVFLDLPRVPPRVTAVIGAGSGTRKPIATFRTIPLGSGATASIILRLPFEYASWVTPRVFSVSCSASPGSPTSAVSGSVVTTLPGGDDAARSTALKTALRVGHLKSTDVRWVELGLTLSRYWLTYAVVTTKIEPGQGVLHWTGTRWRVVSGPRTAYVTCGFSPEIEKQVFGSPVCPS
jgi:hypothetical protein